MLPSSVVYLFNIYLSLSLSTCVLMAYDVSIVPALTHSKFAFYEGRIVVVVVVVVVIMVNMLC
ncbi:hypothetical protein F5Y09DRAFT_324075 [Xylaria sp. FL1042]|nr:hypothetical protein F5Y09DRAFT_324075 [Xylaria sp. FL1042]